MEYAQAVPLFGIAGEPGLGSRLARGTNRGKVPAILGAAGSEGGIVALGDGEEVRGSRTKRRCARFRNSRAQEDPAAFLAPFGEARIAENPDMTRDARLALAQNLGKLAHRQLHGGEQAHDAQSRRVGKRAQERVDPHGHGFCRRGI